MIRNPMEGRIAEIRFDSGRRFRIDFLPGNRLRWTSIREQDYGVTDVEDTHVEILGDGLFAIDWIEKSGLCVSYSVDVNARFVRSYMSWAEAGGPYGGRGFLTHEGPFFFILDDGRPDPRPFTNLQIARALFTAAAQDADLEAAGEFLAGNFVFRNNGLRQGKAEFLSYLRENSDPARPVTDILSANVDKNTVFIETPDAAQTGGAMHVFTLEDGLVTAWRQIGRAF